MKYIFKAFLLIFFYTFSSWPLMVAADVDTAGRDIIYAELPVVKSSFPAFGDLKCLVILIDFPDQQFSKDGTREMFEARMNQENYSLFKHTGSVKDYFIKQSGGKFTPHFDVMGPIRMSRSMTYYGTDDGATGYDIRPQEIVREACKALDSQIDFAAYDYDKDGEVDFVYFFYAGYAQSQGAPSFTLWPHASSLEARNISLVLDDVKINRYACSSELSSNTGSDFDGIGSFVHEFSHILGLQDLYDIFGINIGMDAWSVMDKGCYNNNGFTPCNYSAFERYRLGWLEFEELALPQDGVVLPELSSSNKAYVVRSKNENEFFILENRQRVNWDTYIATPSTSLSGGMMITHVDYDPAVWSNNQINVTTGHPRLKIVPADNQFYGKDKTDYFIYINSLKKDLYPIAANNSFTDTSTPSSVLFDGSFLDKPITNITRQSDKIVFDFMKGYTHLDGNPENLPFRIRTSAHSIILKANERLSVKIYDMTGRLVRDRICEEGESIITMDQKGSFLLRIDGYHQIVVL